jgi:hypothetical protein
MAVKVKTPLFTASYCFVLESKENLSGEQKYSISMLFDKDKTDMEALEEAVAEAAAEKFGKKLPKKFKSPIRDGDEDRSDREEYENMWFINASSSRKPGIIDKETGQAVTSDDEEFGIYSGCDCIATVAFFGFDQKGNKGVGCGLNNIMVVSRGDRLDGTTSASGDFAEDLDNL